MKRDMKKVKDQGRQGDVFVMRRAEQPAKAAEVPRENGAIVLAHGEVTGHAHKVRDTGVCFLRAEGVAYDLLRVDGDGFTLKHELPGGGQADHGPIPFGPGTFEVRIQQEWDYLAEMARSVED
jgi:hypothetical protein